MTRTLTIRAALAALLLATVASPAWAINLPSGDVIWPQNKLTCAQQHARPNLGALCWNGVTKKWQYYDGTQWQNVGTAGTTGSLDDAYDNGGTVTVDGVDVILDLGAAGASVNANAKTGITATDGFVCSKSGTGVMTDCLDASESSLVNALNPGANDIPGTNWSITGSSGVLACGGVTLGDSKHLILGAGTDLDCISDGTDIDCINTGAINFGDGGTTNYISIAANGVVTFVGAAQAVFNDSVELRFGTSGGESTIISDGSNTLWDVDNGSVCIGDGGTTNATCFPSTGVPTFPGFAGSDSSFGISGVAGSAGSAGGAIPIAGGAGHTNGAGGAASLTGGAGAGTGNGGASSVVGGQSGSGATGNGGAVALTGGAALSTAGTGGAATVTGGASAGAGGVAGGVTLDAGAATGGSAAGVTVGSTNSASVTICNTATCDTVSLGTNTDADAITIGDTTDTTVLVSNLWAIPGTGIATFPSVDVLTAGAFAVGNTTATSVSVCNSAACDTITIGSNADADTITIGDSTDTAVSITEDNWSINTSGVGTLASLVTNTFTGASAATMTVGDTISTAVSVCNSAACDTITIGSNADADTITIGDSTDTGVSITDDNWSVTAPGVAVFVSATLSGAAALTLQNTESINTGTDAAFDFTRNDAGAVTITSSDDNSTADMTLDPGGNAALTLGSASDTIAVPVTAGIALSNSEGISNGTDGTLFFGRNDAGIVTLTAKDDDSTAALTVLPGGAAAMVLGGASMTSLTVTTDGTGTAEVALPAGSIAGAEILDGTIQAADIDYAGHAQITVCGDLTTVNNNTVYYGPNTAVSASGTGGLTCDTTAAGNTTEATADAPVFTGKAFQVRGMVCRNADTGATVSYTLRSAAAATTPSVTCSVADNELDCVADVQTTTEVASAATIAVAAASSADMAGVAFVCTIDIVY